MSDRRWFAELAESVRANGYVPLPVRAHSKRTPINSWPDYGRHGVSNEVLAHWRKMHGGGSLALVLGRACAIDIDLEDADLADAAENIARDVAGDAHLVRVGRPPRRAILFRAEGALRSRKCGAVDLLAAGKYVLAFGMHPAGIPYAWRNRDPADTPLSSLSGITPAQLSELERRLADLQGLGSPRLHATQSGQQFASRSHDGLITDGREGFLTKLVWAHVQQGGRDDNALTAQVWEEFTRGADLTRPMGDSLVPYSPEIVREKVLYALKRVPTHGAGTFWTRDRNERFAGFVARYALHHGLSRTAVRTSEAMLAFVRGNDVCSAAVATLAHKMHLSIDALKPARAELRMHRLWSRTSAQGGASRAAEYRPVKDTLGADPAIKRCSQRTPKPEDDE